MVITSGALVVGHRAADPAAGQGHRTGAAARGWLTTRHEAAAWPSPGERRSTLDESFSGVGDPGSACCAGIRATLMALRTVAQAPPRLLRPLPLEVQPKPGHRCTCRLAATTVDGAGGRAAPDVVGASKVADLLHDSEPAVFAGHPADVKGVAAAPSRRNCHPLKTSRALHHDGRINDDQPGSLPAEGSRQAACGHDRSDLDPARPGQ